MQEKFFDERVLAVVGPDHPLAHVRSVTLDQLRPFDWILPTIETTLRRQADQFFVKQDQFTPASAIESVSYLANRSLLRSQDYIGLMPARVAALDIERGLLVQLDWPVPFGAGPVGVSYRGAHRPFAGQCLVFRSIAQGCKRDRGVRRLELISTKRIPVFVQLT